MRKVLMLALAGVLSCGAALAHELVTPPPVPHPLPQGVPQLVVGATPHFVTQLRFGIVNGRRVLFDPYTMRIVYVLHP